MTAMQLNAELFRQLSYIADSEDSMRKALRAIKRIVANAQKTEHTEHTERHKGLYEAMQDVKAGRVYHADSAEDLIKQCLQ